MKDEELGLENLDWVLAEMETEATDRPRVAKWLVAIREYRQGVIRRISGLDAAMGADQ